jgi:hypothetical protein
VPNDNLRRAIEEWAASLPRRAASASGSPEKAGEEEEQEDEEDVLRRQQQQQPGHLRGLPQAARGSADTRALSVARHATAAAAAGNRAGTAAADRAQRRPQLHQGQEPYRRVLYDAEEEDEEEDD